MTPELHSLGYEDKEKSGSIAEQRRSLVDSTEGDAETLYASKYGVFGSVLDKLLATGIEARGIERVPEDQRDSKHTWNKYVLSGRVQSTADFSLKPFLVVVGFYLC